ncbi:MAG: hypothetical protein MJE66_01815, partial [Proteobacteria bacterium]|nr:hypothetical protein [Pseudomonadota bacterium]
MRAPLRLAALAALAALLVAGRCGPAPSSPPLNIAHRGGTVAAPENTLPNYQWALDSGVDWIEIDVWQSSDGVLVCHHDETLNRTTNGVGRVYDHTFAELRALDAGSWFSEDFAGERIPSLAEALELILGQGGQVLLDIKRAEYVEPIATLVRDLGYPANRVHGWIRYGPIMADNFHAHFPDSKLIFGAGHWEQFDEELMASRAQAGDDGIAFNYQTLNRSVVNLTHSYGLQVYAFKVLSPAYSNMINLGVDGLVVASPAALDPLLEGPTPRCSDGLDNDGDGLVDFPEDPSCYGPESDDERTACSDGADNDGDGRTDFPADPGCFAAYSLVEETDCDDGVDNNGDGLVDAEDLGCFAPSARREGAQCADGLDNDGDGLTDYPLDPGCAAASDDAELECEDSDPIVAIAGTPTTGSTIGATDDFTPSCSASSTATEIAHSLAFPGALDSLHIDTIGSAYDTVLYVKRDGCVAVDLACDDDGSGVGTTSAIDLAAVDAGTLFLFVDGWN